MTVDKRRTSKSTTLTTEYGSFIRKKYRRGKKRRQKTTILKRNKDKVVLDRLGDLEFYVYPKEYPDKVFIGLYPFNTYIEEQDLKAIFRIHNKLRWYFSEEWTNKPKKEKGAKFLRRHLETAYNHALERIKKKKPP